MPFFEKVTRGKNVPRERLTEVAEHYDHFGGAGLINQRNRELIAALMPNCWSMVAGCRSIGATAMGIRCFPMRFAK